MVGNRVLVDFRDSAFLGPHATGEITEMIDRQRNVGVQGLADGLAVIDGLGVGKDLEVLLKAIGDLEEHVRALGRGGAAPFVCCGMGGIQRQLDILGGRARHLGIGLERDRRCHIEVLALYRGYEFAADKVVVLRLELDFRIGLARHCIKHY